MGRGCGVGHAGGWIRSPTTVAVTVKLTLTQIDFPNATPTQVIAAEVDDSTCVEILVAADMYSADTLKR